MRTAFGTTRPSIVAGILAIFPVLPAIGQTEAAVHSLVIARFAEGGHTRVRGWIEIPGRMLTRSEDDIRYEWQVIVADSGGRTLVRESGVRFLASGPVPALVAHEFAFRAPPGRYWVETVVVDLPTGRQSVQRQSVRSFDRVPLVSDLALLRGVEGRAPVPRSAAPFELAVVDRLPSADRVSGEFSFEVYRTPTNVSAVVVDKSGVVRARLSLRRTSLTNRSEVMQGDLEPRRLGSGEYSLRIDVAFPDTSVTRIVPVVVPGPAPDFFAHRSERELDSLYAPVGGLLLEAQARGAYSVLDVDDKRAYLARFWRDRVEERTAFYRRVSESNALFDERSGPGWRSDRGGIFVRHGPPGDRLVRRRDASRPAFEAWQFRDDFEALYVFVDPTARGRFVLMYTNGPERVDRPGWREMLGPAVVSEILRP